MAEWKPRSDGIKELVTLLVESQQPGADQQKILSKLDEYRRLPEFNNYLAHIVAQGDNFPIEVRQSAGLLLKNNLKAAKGGISDESKAYVKSAILPAIGHPHESIRATVGTTLAVLAASGAMERWPEIPSALMSALYGDNSHAQQGALDTFIKILEDSPQQMTIQPPGLQEKPSCLVVPRTLQLFKSDDATVRKLAVRLLNQLASTLMPPALVDALREYINGLYFLAGQDTTSETRKEVCTGLTQMLQIHPQLLEEQLTNVIQFMLTATQSEEEGVALESCDFWSAFCESKLDPAALEPFLAQLVPVLLKNMIYDEHDEDIIEAEAAEAEAAGSTVGNRDQDLRPFHRQHPAHVSGAGVLDNGMEEEELAGGDDDDEEDGVRWNLRKSSARGLDFLSVTLNERLLPLVLGEVEQRLSSTEWRLKESAILALGAIADGCMAGLAQLVPTMVAVFLRMADDQHPLVRSHTCWTMGRYSHLLIEQAVQEGKFEQLDAVVTKLLERLLDGNRFVQKSACTGVATLVEDAAEKITFDPLASKLPMMLQAIATVLARYSKRMMRSLYDVISTLCEAAKSYMCEPQYANLLLPPLIAKWRTMDNADKELLPLMECLAFALTHTKSCCEQYAPEVLKRSLELAEAHLELLKKERQGHLLPGEVEPDEDFVALALYTVSGLVEGLGASMQPLLVQRSSFIPLLAACCQDPSADIRAEAFALLGDLSKVTPSQLLDHATGFCQAALHNLQPAMLSATNARSCTNACWALTRLLPLMPQQQSQSLVLHCLQVSVPLIEAPKQQVPPKLRENSAILVSCAAAISPAEVGSHMPRFLGPWSGSVAPMRAGPEKAVATHGLLQALKANPQVATHSLPSVVSALMSWRQQDCPAGVWADLVAVLKAFQDMMGVAWSEMVVNLQPGLQSKLQQLLAS